MRIRCKKCGWLQDCFWSENYNPLDELVTDHMKACLMSYSTTKMDTWMADECGISYSDSKDGECTVDSKDYVVFYLQEAVNKIRNMMWRTDTEWKVYKTANGPKCPKCNENSLIEEAC